MTCRLWAVRAAWQAEAGASGTLHKSAGQGSMQLGAGTARDHSRCRPHLCEVHVLLLSQAGGLAEQVPDRVHGGLELHDGRVDVDRHIVGRCDGRGGGGTEGDTDDGQAITVLLVVAAGGPVAEQADWQGQGSQGNLWQRPPCKAPLLPADPR